MRDLSHLQIVNADSRESVTETLLADWTTSGKHKVINFIYYSNFILLNNDKEYFRSMALSDVILIDGIGMQLYLKIVKNIWPSNLNGTDLSPLLLKRMDELNIPIAFYGTTSESVEKAASNTSAYLPNKSLYYFQDGFRPLDWNEIRNGSALFVGMGSPRQENWVEENYNIIKEKQLFLITIGGYFDFASGFYTRAPLWVRKVKLEWAYRTMLHPKRHLKKRFRDLTILFKPFWDKLTQQGKKLNIRKI
ncbi:MAG: WecB/TagA/CpsF family glycosyltransferase [Bacteroidetes bacterium]|nr:WecB/TagA/CpsF family glycosyltransferase [Bacteroidota bacterium]